MRTLDFGLMMSVAYPMRREEREAVAAFIGKGKDDIAPPASALCRAGHPHHVLAIDGFVDGLGPAHRTTRASRTPRRRASMAAASATSS